MAAAYNSSCNLCQQWTYGPLVLYCGHNLCQNCLDYSTFSKDSSKCPVCPVDFQMAQGGLNNLTINERVESGLRTSIICDGCKTNEATQFCSDCSYNYCSTCLVFHGRIPMSRDHRLQPILPNVVSRDKIYSTCLEHSELMNTFCRDCNVFACSYCMILKHGNHKLQHMSDYIDSEKVSIGEALKIKEKSLKLILSNYAFSEALIYENKSKALNLKKEIKQRGEDIKKNIDSIVAKIIKKVDEEFIRCKARADDVLRELEQMEIILKTDIEALNTKLNDLRFKHLPEASPQMMTTGQIPKYSEKFDMFFYFDDEELANTKKLFGTVWKTPKINLVRQDSITSTLNSFAIRRGDVISCYCPNNRLFFYRNNESSNEKLEVDYNFDFIKINNLLTVADILYFAYTCDNNMYNIAKVSNETHRSVQIYKHQISYDGHLVRLSKSLNGNILFILSRKIVHLSTNGEEVKAYNLKFDIFDALELDKKSYVVSLLSEICTINCEGNRLLSYSCYNNNPPLSFDIRALSVAKDNRGNIYVNDYWKKEILVLDQCLNLRSSVTVDKSLVDIVYDEEKNKLIALSNLNKDYFALIYEL